MSKSGSLLNLYKFTMSAVFAFVGLSPSDAGAQTPQQNPQPVKVEPVTVEPAVTAAPAESGLEEKAVWNNVPTDDRKMWTPSVFGGDGEVTFSKESIQMTAGDPITGIRCLAEIPKENFEIELEGRRKTNFDFFCALTFPVGVDGRCSFVVGGWAGAVVGLSSIDGLDAARNSTKKLMHFENGQWYKIRVRVDSEEIRCWIDDELIVQQPRAEHAFDIRVEMHESLPVGIAAFMCDSEIRNFRWRKLDVEK